MEAKSIQMCLGLGQAQPMSTPIQIRESYVLGFVGLDTSWYRIRLLSGDMRYLIIY